MSEKYKISFINQKLTIEAEEGTTISKSCEMAGFPLDLVCNGRGTCGKCKVTIEKNNEKSIVLACTTKIKSDLNIYLNLSDYNRKANILETNTIDDSYEFKPSVTKIYVDIKNIKKENSGEYLRGCDLNILKKFSDLIHQHDCKGITFIMFENYIIDMQLNDTTAYLYGAAVDIGTTSVVVYIYDLNTGKSLKTYSNLNMQISFGADVISRIYYADNKTGLDELTSKIIQTINNMVNKADFELSYFKDNLYNIVLCGNSTMQHLLFNLRPDSLGVSPFVNIINDYIECWGSDLSINCANRCKIVFLPLLGGFVGGDTTSVLLTVESDDKDKLIIDLGTNGEIAVGNMNRYIVASTACGPAFEGGSIECGMRGSNGAIQNFKIEDDKVRIRVIGDTYPIGICGSGIIDITCELLRENIIDNTGRMATKEEFVSKRPESELCENLTPINGINSFVIFSHDDRKVYITQKDIRQVQLAKSSIYSGCTSLIEAYGTRLEDLDEIVIAGAFGNYIDVDNAISIGLLPSIDKSKITSIGNGAGKGVCMHLLNKDMKKKCDEIVKNSVHYELANDQKFTDGYIMNMNFHTKKY